MICKIKITLGIFVSFVITVSNGMDHDDSFRHGKEALKKYRRSHDIIQYMMSMQREHDPQTQATDFQNLAIDQKSTFATLHTHTDEEKKS